MDIFTRAYNGLNLSPGERAFLKVFQSLLYTAFIAGLLAVYTLLSGSNTPDWGKVFYTGLGAVVVSFLQGLSKYFTAQNDPPLATVIGFAAEQTKQAFTHQSDTRPMPVAPAILPQGPTITTVVPPTWMGMPPNMPAPQATATQFVPPRPIPPTVPPYNPADYTVTGVQPVVQPPQ